MQNNTKAQPLNPQSNIFDESIVLTLPTLKSC